MDESDLMGGRGQDGVVDRAIMAVLDHPRASMLLLAAVAAAWMYKIWLEDGIIWM